MRRILRFVGLILLGFGTIWFLQGMNIMPGSFMTGQMKWAYIGGACFIAGIVLIMIAGPRRRRR